MKALRLFVLSLFAAVLALTACDPNAGEVGKFSVTVTTDGNGSAVADVPSAEPGDIVTITAQANPGFAFAFWEVLSGNVRLDESAVSTTFTMPKADVEIKATFAGEATFVDDVLSYIKDPQFLEYVKYGMNNAQSFDGKVKPLWDKDGNGKLSSDEAAAVTHFSIENLYSGISDMSGIEYFTGLEYLNLSSCSFNEIDLSNNRKLKELNVNMNKRITSIDLSAQTELVSLDAKECPNLSSVNLTKCTNLENIDLYNNGQINNLDVTACTGLVSINVAFTGLKDIDFTKCQNLASVALMYTDITSIDLSSCRNLSDLDLNRCRELKELDLSDCPNLTYLSVSFAQLTELDVTGCVNLRSLYASDNHIKEIDLSNCTKLEWLYIENNELTELDLSACKKIDHLYCYGNHLQELDVTNLQFYVDNGTVTNTYFLYCGTQRIGDYMYPSVTDKEGSMPDFDKAGCSQEKDGNGNGTGEWTAHSEECENGIYELKVYIRPDMADYFPHIAKVKANHKIVSEIRM